jgi:hypothetical protein
MVRVPRRYALVVSALVVIALMAADAGASAEDSSIQAVIRENGSGMMIANGLSNPDGQTWSWEACTPGLEHCTAFAHGQIVSTAGAPPRTVFRALRAAEPQHSAHFGGEG